MSPMRSILLQTSCFFQLLVRANNFARSSCPDRDLNDTSLSPHTFSIKPGTGSRWRRDKTYVCYVEPPSTHTFRNYMFLAMMSLFLSHPARSAPYTDLCVILQSLFRKNNPIISSFSVSVRTGHQGVVF